MRDRLQPHVLCGLGRKRRAHAAGAVKDELLVLLEHRLGIGAGGVDPELQHAAGAGEGAGNPAVALDLAGVADVDDDDVLVGGELDGVDRADGLDLGIGLVDQRLDAAVDGLGHGFSLDVVVVIPGRAKREPGISRDQDNVEVPGSMLTHRPGTTEKIYRTSSFIAFSNSK